MPLLHIAFFHISFLSHLSQGTWCYEILFSAILQDLRIMRMKWDVLSVSSRTCRRNSAKMQRMLTLCAPDFVINWRLSQKWPRNMLRAYWRASKPEALADWTTILELVQSVFKYLATYVPPLDVASRDLWEKRMIMFWLPYCTVCGAWQYCQTA